MKNFKSLLALLLAVVMVAGPFAGCANKTTPEAAPGVQQEQSAQPEEVAITEIKLEKDSVAVDGAQTGTDPSAAVYLSNDISTMKTVKPMTAAIPMAKALPKNATPPSKLPQTPW